MRLGSSSQATTSASPALSARQLASPEPPSPNTATFLPAKVVTGIMGSTANDAADDKKPVASPSSPPPLAGAGQGGGTHAPIFPSAPSPTLPGKRGREQTESAAPSCSTQTSPQLQRRQPHECEHDRDDPEPDHDLRLGPALLLEVMVQRRHAENALAGKLERDHLHDHRHRFEHEQAADDRQHDLVLGGDRDRSEQSAERQRAGVAHENRGRRRVEPEEAQAGAD